MIFKNTCVVVNVKTKKILSLRVTDGHAHESKALPELLGEIIESDSITALGKLFADDGEYDDDVFRNLGDNGILPCIKVRKTSRVGWEKGNILRNLSVLAQKNDLQK